MVKSKNFMARMKSKIARALTKCFPVFSIRRKALLTNPNAEDWMIYDVDKALYLITKLRLTDQEIGERAWAPAVKIALLSSSGFSYGRKALASKVRTDEELEAVLRYGTLEEKVSAVRAFTPSTKRMRELVTSVSTDIGFLNAIAEKAPTAFAQLTAKEVLGLTPKQKCNKAQDWRIDLSLELMATEPSWCPKFMELIKEIPPQQLTDKEKAYFKDIYVIASKAKICLANLLAYMKVFFNEEYILNVNAFRSYPSFAREFAEIFPQMIVHLKKGATHYTSLEMLGCHINENFSEVDEAYAWLGIGRELLGKDDLVYETLLKHIKEIYDVNPSIGKDLVALMTEKARSVGEIQELEKAMPKQVDARKIAERAYQLIYEKAKRCFGYADVKDYIKFYPFTTWKEDHAKWAIKRLVLTNSFPLDRHHELSDELKAYALEQMEVSSQKSALLSNLDQMVEYQLYPEAEVDLLRAIHSHEDLVIKYVDKYGLSDEAFMTIIKYNDYQDECRRVITACAKKWGLTQERYVKLLQSRYIGLAPFLKQYVGKKPELNSTEADA